MRRTPHGGSGTGHGQIAQAELLKLQKTGQFPDDPVRIKDTQIHYVNGKRTNNDSHKGEELKGRSIFVYYESIQRELNKRLILDCRCDSRLKVKTEGSTRLTYTG